MTTIAYRDGVLAADTGAITGSDSYAGEVVKIVKGAGGMGGLTGSVPDAVVFNAWVAAGAKDDPPKLEGVGIIVTPSGEVQIIEGGQRSHVKAPFHALGSGHEVALGALHAGATAEQAVEIAARVDVYTRLPLTVLRLEPAA